jgi:hypothetical protein
VVVITLFTLGAFVLADRFFETPLGEKRFGSVGGVSLAGAASSSHEDSDNDGLYDWEEVVLGTDPYDADSDKDGVPDGEEHKKEKEYANLPYEDIDLLSMLKNPQGILGGGGNITGTLAHEAASRYGFLAQSGSLDQASGNEISNALSSELSGAEAPPRFTFSDVRYSSEINFETTDTYVREILASFKKYNSIYEHDPLALLDEWFENNDSEVLKTVSSLGTIYKNLTNEIVVIPVPEPLASLHLRLSNSLFNSSVALLRMADSPGDPAGGLLGAAAYLRAQKERQDIIITLGTFYQELSRRLSQ